MSIKLNIQLLYRYFQKNQCLNIKNHAAHSLQRLAQDLMLVGPPGNCSACPCVKMALSLLIHFQYICICYVFNLVLCMLGFTNKLEERGNEIQWYMQLYTKFFFPLNSSKRNFISILQTYKQNNIKAVSCNLHGLLNQQNKL